MIFLIKLIKNRLVLQTGLLLLVVACKSTSSASLKEMEGAAKPAESSDTSTHKISNGSVDNVLKCFEIVTWLSDGCAYDLFFEPKNAIDVRLAMPDGIIRRLEEIEFGSIDHKSPGGRKHVIAMPFVWDNTSGFIVRNGKELTFFAGPTKLDPDEYRTEGIVHYGGGVSHGTIVIDKEVFSVEWKRRTDESINRFTITWPAKYGKQDRLLKMWPIPQTSGKIIAQIQAHVAKKIKSCLLPFNPVIPNENEDSRRSLAKEYLLRLGSPEDAVAQFAECRPAMYPRVDEFDTALNRMREVLPVWKETYQTIDRNKLNSKSE